MAGRKKKVFSEPFSTDIPVQMYYGNLVLGKRLSGKLYGPQIREQLSGSYLHVFTL